MRYQATPCPDSVSQSLSKRTSPSSPVIPEQAPVIPASVIPAHAGTQSQIPAHAGTQRKTKHAIYPPLRPKGTRSAANAGDARGGSPFPNLYRHSRKLSVIPAHAGTQRKTNHALYPPLRAAKGTRSEANAGDARGRRDAGLPPFTGEMSEGQRGHAQNTPAISYQ